MLQMPNATSLIIEITAALPLYCTSKKRNTQALAAQGLRLNDRIRLKVTDVIDTGEYGGINCVINYMGQPLVMSITGLDFKGNGEIDKKILEYSQKRIEWLKQEEQRGLKQGFDPRIKVVDTRSSMPSRNGLCPCGSGKKYKRCCGKDD